MRSDLYLTQKYNTTGTTTLLPQWYNEIQLSFNKSIILDRHYLFDIENQVSIAKLIITDTESGKPLQDYGNDYVRLVLTRDCNLELNFRELPVALLRLHFTGHDRFMTWLRRIPHWDLKHLINLARQDQRYIGDDDDAYELQITKLKEYLKYVIDLCYCSFERTLHHFLSQPPDQWPSFGLDEAIANDTYWKNFPYDKGITSAIWFVCVWRIHVARMIEQYLKPWRSADEEQKEWFVYRTRLFRHTHLDILTEMIYKNVFDDEKLVSSKILYERYPNCHRVCCAEELPCLVGYTFDNYKTGSNLKERCTLEARIGHIVTNKPMPNICKVRNVHKIIRRYGNSDKVIFDLIRHIKHCVLLGNIPNAKGSVDIAAAIRITYSMREEVANTVVPKETTAAEVEKKKAKKAKKKAKKKEKKKDKKGDDDDDEDDDDDFLDDDDEKDETLLTRNLYKARHTQLCELKEFLFYTAETSGCFDRILSRNNKWCQHKEIVRAGMGRYRDDISLQCKNLAYDQPIDWTRIEYIYKKDDYDIKTGIIMNVHTLLLKTTEKVKKDSLENILMKKMTSIEEVIKFGDEHKEKDSERHPYTAFMETNGCVTLDELHMIAYGMATGQSPGATETTDEEPVMKTNLLQVVGMSPRGILRVRDWIFGYYVYDIPDNALKKSIIAFQSESMSDYIILKTMIKLIIYYKRDHIFHLPASYAIRQTMALRRLLCVDPLHPTPDLLGVHYMCPGCLKFANPVINPSDYDTPVHEKDTLVISHKKPQKVTKVEPKVEVASDMNVDTVVIEDDNEEDNGGIMEVEDTDDDEDESDDSDSDDDTAIRYTNKKKRRGRKRRSKATLRKMYANNEIRTTTTSNESATVITSSIKHTQAQLQHQYNVPYFNTALYDINSGALHCPRDYKRKKGLLTAHANDTNYVIIKGKKNGLIIESNINRCGDTEREDVQNEQDSSDGDMERGDDDDDDDMMTFNHENELFFMPDDTLDIGDQWAIANRLTLTTEKMAFGDDCRTGGHYHTNNTTNAPKKVNNNKSIISCMVDTPIKQKYTCSTPLIDIDMIGVIINGNALCCECACMTEVTNSNRHSYGITCSRHASPSHRMDHPVWQLDRFTTKQLARYAYLVRPIDATSGLPVRECDTLVSGGPTTKKHRQTEHYHPKDLVHQPCGASQSDLIKCHFCGTMKAIVYVTAIESRTLRLVKKEICYSCKHLCKNFIDACNLRFLDILENHIYIRNSQYTF